MKAAVEGGGSVSFNPRLHLPDGGGLLSILFQNKCRFANLVITLNSLLNSPRYLHTDLSGVRTIDPSDRMLY